MDAELRELCERLLTVRAEITDKCRSKGADCDICDRLLATVDQARDTIAAQAAELEGVRKDAEERVRLHHYWRQRAKSAEGHLFASDLTHAAMAIHARSLKADTPWEELDWREKGARLGCAMDVILRINNRRDERLPKDTAIADSGAGNTTPKEGGDAR